MTSWLLVGQSTILTRTNCVWSKILKQQGCSCQVYLCVCANECVDNLRTVWQWVTVTQPVSLETVLTPITECVCVHLCRSAEYSTALPQLSADQPIKRHSQPRLRPLRQTATSSPSPSVWKSKRMMGRAHLGESLCFSPSIKVDSVLLHISAFNPRGLVSNWIIQLDVIFWYPAFGSHLPGFDEGNDKNS